MQRNRLRFAADGQFHLIITRQGQRSPRADAKVKRAGYLYGIIVTQVPGEPVHSFVWWNRLRALDAIRPLRRLLAFFFLFARKMPDDLDRTVEDLQRDLLLRRLAEIILDDRARRLVIP